MKKKIIVVVLGAFAFLGGMLGPKYYEKYLDKKQAENERRQLQHAINTNVDLEELKNSPEAVDLNWDECKDFTELFNTEEYNGFYVATYANTDEIFWNTVLADGAGIKRKSITKEEKEFYLEKNEEDYLDYELVGISSSDLDSYIYNHSGTRLKSIKNDLDWTYNKEQDAYYKELGYSSYEPCTCVSGFKVDNIYVLNVASDNLWSDAYIFHPNKEIVMIKTESGYVFKSNQNMWEVGNDSENTLDLDIPQIGDSVRLVSFHGDESFDEDGTTAVIAIIVNNEMIDYDWLRCFKDDESYNIKSIEDVGCFDVNADGINDIVIVGYDFNFEDKAYVLTCEETDPYDKSYKLNSCDELSIGLSKELGKNITLNAIKEALLGENGGVYSTWQEAYKQFVKVKGSGYDEKYTLAYIDDDDIPELILDSCDTLSVYTYKGGLVSSLAIDYDYYVTGNYPYQYSYKTNWVKKYEVDDMDDNNSDYAYYTIRNGTLDRLSAEETKAQVESIERNHFIDLVGKYTADKFIDEIDK